MPNKTILLDIAANPPSEHTPVLKSSLLYEGCLDSLLPGHWRNLLTIVHVAAVSDTNYDAPQVEQGIDKE